MSRRTRTRIVSVVPLLCVLLVAGCGGSNRDDSSGGTCIINETNRCPCSDGTTSSQTCLDGKSYSVCQCGSAGTDGAAGSGASGGTPGAAGTGGAGTAGGTGGAAAGASGASGTGGAGGSTEADSGQAGADGSAGTGDAGGPTPHGTSTCLQGTGDYSEAGPYQVATKAGVDLAAYLPDGSPSPTTYTIFYPADLEADCPRPIIAWGNGTTVSGSQVYAFYQKNAASWGMVVIASDNPGMSGFCVGTGNYHKAGIEYLLAQNKDSSSEFYGKLSTRAGVAGHSQGGFGATTATSHANVEALVQIQGGGVPKQGVAALCLSGTADTVVGTTAPTQTFNAATGPAFLAIYEGADHVSTPTLAGYAGGQAGTIQFMRLYTAWFRCFLADDAEACALFKGGDTCGICSDPNWDTLQSRNM